MKRIIEFRFTGKREGNKKEKIRFNKIMKTLKKITVATLFIAFIFALEAKDKKGVIMKVDGEEIPSEEFVYLFQKNNQQQTYPQTLDEYLDLFEIYRLKVAEAKKQGVDTTLSFKKEMDVYRKELLEPYLTDTVILNQMINEAAERENTVVESSHIMIIRTNNPETDERNLQLLDSLHKELLNGADFITIAKEYSQDKFSSDKGGYLGFAPAGTFPYGFETAVYETPEGGISEIVESHVGWHIVKSGARKSASELQRPVKSYEDVKNDVMRKITSPFDPRYHQLRQNIISKLRVQHPEVNISGMNEDDAYNALVLAEEDYQYKNNPDYRNLVDEYTNGSLLYEVSVENVWNKASNDTEGLEKYYQANKNNYNWESPHAKGILVQALNDSVAEVIKLDISSLPTDSIVLHVRKNYRKEATADKFNVPQGVNSLIDHLMFGVEEVTPGKNFKSYFVVEGRLVESPEELNDVKGSVVNDYQIYLEKEWIDQLKKTHTVEINKKELGTLRKKLKN